MSLQPRFRMCLAVGILLAGVASVDAQDEIGQLLKLDNFKFYEVKPVSTAAQLDVQGQFDKDSVSVNLSSITMFSNPVTMDGGKLINSRANLTWYKLTQELEEPYRAIEFENQLGRQEILVRKPVALLVPTRKVKAGGEFSKEGGLDFFKVYEVMESRPLSKNVTLKDKFGAEEVAGIVKTMYFAVPVMKKAGDKVAHNFVNVKAHLTIYALTPNIVETVDLIGNHKLSNIQSRMLALPTEKIAWKALE